jgi:hypothetical protein
MKRFKEYITEDIKSDISKLTDKLKKQYDIKLSLYHSPRTKSLSLNKIIVPEDKRNVGTGTKVMKEITKYADKNDLIISLTPSTDFGGSKTKLIDFYKKLGFVMNKGKNKNYEFTDLMLRYPV